MAVKGGAKGGKAKGLTGEWSRKGRKAAGKVLRKKAKAALKKAHG